MQLHKIATVVLGFCLAVSFGASADGTDGPTLTEIRAQQIELRADVQAGDGIFKEMDRVKREQLATRQTQLLAMIEGKDLVQDLDDDVKVEAFNLLEQINATINDTEGQRMVCERVRKVGSHRTVKQCMTVAERRQLRQDTQNTLLRELQSVHKDPMGNR